MTKIRKDKYNFDLTSAAQRMAFVELIADYLNLNKLTGCLYIFIDKYYVNEEKSYLIDLYNSLITGDTNDISNRIILYTLLLKKLNEICDETRCT